MFAYTCLSGSFLLLTCYKPKQRPDEKLQNKNVLKHMSCKSLKLMIWLNLGRLLQQAKWMIALAEWHHIKEIYFMTFPEYMNCLNNIWVYWTTSELSRQCINIFPCHLMIISAHKMPQNWRSAPTVSNSKPAWLWDSWGTKYKRDWEQSTKNSQKINFSQ